MCGIVGYWDTKERKKLELPLLKKMLSRLVHRGPDSEGYYEKGFFSLGFRRLKIVDLETGDQPLFNEDASLALVCNGEIFNAPLLRQEMEDKGHVFSSHSDSEVLLHLYEEYGRDLLSKLNGQFAFALFDVREQSLFLARDHFGIIPLFYYWLDGILIFASEIKAILECPWVERKVDLTGLDQVLSFPGLVSPRTMFSGISSMESGHSLFISRSLFSKRMYWDLCYPLPGELPEKSEVYYQENLEHLLNLSIQRRLQADVPLGSYLSGGLDSSLITVLMERLASRSQDTFSIRFPQREMDESFYQALIEKKHKGKHHSHLFSPSEIVDILPQMIWHCECPVKETYNVCSWQLAAMARKQGIPVILSGEGADELFAGYVGYRFDVLREKQDPEYGLEAILEEEVREALWGDPSFFYEKNQYAWQEVKRSLYSSSLLENLSSFSSLLFPLVKKEALQGQNVLHKRSYLDFKLRLADHLLGDHGDRMAMAHAVEMRYPFLDIDLVEFAAQIPPRFKLNQYREKHILKSVAQGILPSEIIEREKFGFRAPGTPYLLQEKNEWVEDMLSWERIKRQGYWNPITIERLKKKYAQPGFQLNTPFEDDLLMIVLSFNILLEQFTLPCFR